MRNLGKFGEELACKYLLYKGYTIIGRNIRSGHDEIDILAQKGLIYYAFEVRTRCASLSRYSALEFPQIKLYKIRRAISKLQNVLWRNATLKLIAVSVLPNNKTIVRVYDSTRFTYE